MRNYVSEGNIVTYTAAAAVTAGEPVLFGSSEKLMVVPATSAATGEKFAGAVEGVFELTKESTADFSEGDIVYWDDTNKEVDESASGRFAVGFAYEAAGASTTTCKVKLFARPVAAVA